MSASSNNPHRSLCNRKGLNLSPTEQGWICLVSFVMQISCSPKFAFQSLVLMSEVVPSKPVPLDSGSGFCTRMILLSTKRYCLLLLQKQAQAEYQNDSAQNQTLLVTGNKTSPFCKRALSEQHCNKLVRSGSEKEVLLHAYPFGGVR